MAVLAAPNEQELTRVHMLPSPKLPAGVVPLEQAEQDVDKREGWCP